MVVIRRSKRCRRLWICLGVIMWAVWRLLVVVGKGLLLWLLVLVAIWQLVV
jgi:hypothetical protein